MRILIVTQYFHPEPFRINDLVLALSDRGHKVTVLTGIPNYPEGRLYAGYGHLTPLSEDYHGVSVIRAPMMLRGTDKGWRLLLNFVSFAVSACVVGPSRCRGEFDVVFVFEPSPITVGLPGMLMGKLKRAPVILWIQDLWPETLAALGQRGPLSRVAAWIAQRVHRGCDLLLVQSVAFTQSLTSRGISQARVRYLPNWAEDFYKRGVQDSTSDPLEKFQGTRILFAGNIGSAQSFETIVGAAKLLKHRRDIHWIVVGDGLMRAKVEEWLDTHGLRATVALLGRFPPERMPALFSHADALLVTLRADPVFSLTIPSKIQSYLASGNALVGALNGEGARVITESGAGFVANAGDAQGLAQCVLQIAALSPADRARMGRRGREYYDLHFERNKLIGQIEAWMRESIKTKHADADIRR